MPLPIKRHAVDRANSIALANKMTSIVPCPLCGESGSIPIFHDHMPLYHVLESGATFNDCPFADLVISQCQKCLHLFNAAADVALLNILYRENAITNIPVNPSMFARFSEVASWLGEEAYENNDVIEIGAGAGYLARILARKARTVTVFEPNRRVNMDRLLEQNIIFIPSTFPNPSLCPSQPGSADLVICRNVLEHVPDPLSFLTDIAKATRPGGSVYIEVPDVDFTIRHSIFSDFYLQHIHYFTINALQSIARCVGLLTKRVAKVMGGHDFGILFVKAEGPTNQNSTESASLPSAEFMSRLFTKSKIHARESIAALPEPLGLYGANLISQSFLCAVSDLRRFVVVFDDNPTNTRKMFVDRSGLIPISSFTQDSSKLVKSIVIGAFLHDQAIRARLQNSGFSGNIFTAGPPTPIQPTL